MRPLGTTLAALPAALLLSAALLTGCGSDAEVLYGEDPTTPAASPDPGSTQTEGQTEEQTDGQTEEQTDGQTEGQTDGQTDGDAPEPVDYEVVALPSASAAGGTVAPMLTPVGTADELDSFVAQFERDELAEEVRTAATSASYDGQLWAAVVSLGCDVPPGVQVEEGEAGYLATPEKVADPLDSCLVPVTTVALVAIP